MKPDLEGIKALTDQERYIANLHIKITALESERAEMEPIYEGLQKRIKALESELKAKQKQLDSLLKDMMDNQDKACLGHIERVNELESELRQAGEGIEHFSKHGLTEESRLVVNKVPPTSKTAYGGKEMSIKSDPFVFIFAPMIIWCGICVILVGIGAFLGWFK